MLPQWYSNLPKAEQEKFKELVRGSKKVLDRLREICYNTKDGVLATSKTDYDSPSWAYKQADRNGYIRAYEEIAKLCDISDKDF